jgi:hypothetical protein
MARKSRKIQPKDDAELLDSFVFKFSSKLLLSLIVVITFLTLVQCTIKKPEAPTWDTQLVVPVINRIYDMPELIERIDQAGLQYDGDSNLVYSISEQIDTFRLGAENLITNNVSYSVTEQLTPVEITAPDLPPVVVGLSEIGGLSAWIPGTVPALSFQLVDTLPVITTFSSADIVTGIMYIVIANDIGVDLDSIRVNIYNIGQALPFSSQVLSSGVTNGSVDSVAIPLGGQTISNQLRVISDCYTGGGTVISASNKEIRTTATFPDAILVNAAVAEIPALVRSFSAQVALSDTDEIHQAVLGGGTVDLTISNNTQVGADILLTIPSLTLGGAPLQVARIVSPQSFNNVSIDLSGYTLTPDLSTQEIDLDIVANIAGSGGQMVTIDNTQGFSIDALLSSLSFASVTGVFTSTGADITPFTQEIAVPTGFEDIELVEAILTLDVYNGVGLPGSLNVVLNGSNGKSLNVSGFIQTGSFSLPALTSLTDTTVADFLTPIPESIDIYGSATFGDGVSVATLTSSDFVFAEVNVLSPLKVIINASTVETDIEREEINQDDINLVTDHVNEARFIYNVISHLPIGARFDIYLGSDSATLFANPQLIIDNIFITAAPTGAGGVVSDTISAGYQSVILDSLDIRILENDTLFIGNRLTLESSNGLAVALTNNDYLKVVGRFEVDYRFDGEF